MSVEGIRVVRGPDWSYGDDDGGEGHVGTVTQDNEDDTVEVQWDMGNSGTYNTGNDGKCDLRILDSAPAGLKHGDVFCDSCKKKEFPGTRWKCQTCTDFDLCSPCYFGDNHSLQHPFLRIDAPGLKGMTVPKRSVSNKIRALGMYKGSKVRRGVDWNCGNQDGGDGKVGSVLEMKNYGMSGAERDSVTVTWPNKESNSYRVGFRGKVDLLCIEETPGMDFYRDHLFAMNTSISRSEEDTKPVPKDSMQSSKRASLIRSKSFLGEKLQIGDKVCVELPEIALKEVQRGHGGWSMRMKEVALQPFTKRTEVDISSLDPGVRIAIRSKPGALSIVSFLFKRFPYIGQHGILKRFEENGDCVINYDGKEWRFNADAVRKVPSLKVGDTVRIDNDSDKVQALQKRHGGWQSEMDSVLGKVGKVVKIDSDGDVAVAFGNKAYVFNPACCIAAPGEKIFNLGESGSGGGGGAEGRGGAEARAEARPGSGKGGRKESDDDTDRDDAADALGQLIAQLFLLRGLQRSAAGPQHLIAAAAKNDIETVQAILKQNPGLIDQKHQGLTALIISSHEGHKNVVALLLKTGANKDITESKGNTALMAALMKKREEIAMMLIEVGANIKLWNQSGRTALHFAASNSCNTTLKELLSKGADPNKQDIVGDTPLHEAIQNKNDFGTAFLVADPKMNLKICNTKGLGPLHLAAMKDDEITVSRILSKAPELKNATRSDGNTALHVAAVNNNTDVVKTLIKAKVDIDRLTSKRYTALHLACHQGYIETSKLLVEASANVNIQDEDGDTCLHNTIMGRRDRGQEEVLARLLLGMRMSNEGEMKDRTNLACFLIQNGANLTIRNKKGRTPLECCTDERMRNAIRMFAEKQGRSGGSTNARSQTAGALFAELLSDMLTPCMGCMLKIADTRFAPCGHRVCCKQCSFRVRECPMCDRAIQERYDLEGRRLVIDPCKVQ